MSRPSHSPLPPNPIDVVIAAFDYLALEVWRSTVTTVHEEKVKGANPPSFAGNSFISPNLDLLHRALTYGPSPQSYDPIWEANLRAVVLHERTTN